MTRSDRRSRRTEPGPAPVSPAEEPSAQWGWHGGFPRGSVIAGWSTVAILLAMLTTNLVSGHNEGHTPDIYLGVISAALICLLTRHGLRARRCWRR